jgi:shikimate dehydrogenase
MKVYGIIGYPLGHSFSKKYFADKFLKEGINNCRYETFPIKTAQELKVIVDQTPGLCGLNITIPHKQSIVSLLDDLSHLPPSLKACNCIKFNNGRSVGYNTDVIGFEQSLLPQLQSHHTKALILGNGGAAEAVKFVLTKLHISFKVVSRQLHHGSHFIYSNLNETILKEHLLIINTTPLGTFPNINECADIPYQFISPSHYLFDLVYNPAKTLFLQKGEEKGAVIKNGYKMLEIQAEESWKIWNRVD